MTTKNENAPAEPRPRKPYEAPAVIADDTFETRALSCVNNPGACRGRGRGNNRS